MRNPVLVVVTSATILLAGSTAFLFLQNWKASADYRQLRVAEENTRALYAETIQAVAEIQDSLNAIAVGDTNVALTSGNLLTEQRLSGPSGRDALDRIAVLRAGISRNKERIRDLESNLKRNGTRISGLERVVANLKRTVAEKEALVAQLSLQVDSLQTEVSGLVAEVEESEQTLRARERVLEEKRRELATVYYVVGNKKLLTTSGVVEAKGGLLGLGRTLQPTGRLGPAAATPLDTDRETVVPIPSARVQVLSAQPPSSYELRPVGGRTELHILDPAEFRKVKQVVILTT